MMFLVRTACFFLLLSPGANATIIYDEAIDGDALSYWNGYQWIETDLGQLSAGANVIKLSGEWSGTNGSAYRDLDTFRFKITNDQVITQVSFEIINPVFVGYSSLSISLGLNEIGASTNHLIVEYFNSSRNPSRIDGYDTISNKLPLAPVNID